jgi:hypothetical protein
VWAADVVVARQQLHAETAFQTACCLPLEEAGDNDNTSFDKRALLGADACAAVRSGNQHSAANVCVQCSPSSTFVLCDSCVCNAALIHDPNHAFLVLLDDALPRHRLIEQAWPLLRDENKPNLLWVRIRYNKRDRCTVCSKTILSSMYVNVENKNRKICRTCFVKTIQDGKR